MQASSRARPPGLFRTPDPEFALRPMHRISTLIPVLIALALTAACAPDKAGDDAQDPSAQQAAEEEAYVPPQLTPAESIAAVEKIQAQSEAKTREIMGPDYKPPAEPYVDTPEKQYASCMAQANSVEDPVRSTILKACERFRREAEKN
jgi:hypothetical protein